MSVYTVRHSHPSATGRTFLFLPAAVDACIQARERRRDSGLPYDEPHVYGACPDDCSIDGLTVEERQIVSEALDDAGVVP